MFPTSANIKFTDSQKHALDCQRNLAVRANAGSGKTSVLVDRILQILKHHMGENLVDFSPDQGVTLTQIVSITFTRKAAAELKQRLRGLLLEQIHAEGIQSWEGDWWEARLAELEIAEIGTIDSFFGGILREYALYDTSESPVEPDFQILEPFEAEQLRERAIQSVLHMADKGHKELQEALTWWKRLDGPKPLEENLLTLLGHSAGVKQILARNKKIDPEVEVQRLIDNHPAKVKILEFPRRAKLADQIREIISIIDGAKITNTVAALREHFSSLLSSLQNPEDFQPTIFLSALKNLIMTSGKRRGFGQLRKPNLEAAIQNIQEDWVNPLSIDMDPELEKRALHARNHLMIILDAVFHEYMRLCTCRNALDFDTVARKVLWLFESFPQVPEELKKRYRFIQVDEFQDTSKLQWEILSYLAGNGPDQLLDKDRLFIVGDPQQSIYGFRQADVAVFQEVQNLILRSNKKHGHHLLETHYESASQVMVGEHGRLGEMRLSENFRTLEFSTLQLFNKLFTYVFNHDDHAVDWSQSFQVKFQTLIPGISGDAQGETVYLEYATPTNEKGQSEPADGDEETGEDIDRNQVRMIADELIHYHGKPRKKPDRNNTARHFHWKDMAILIPTRNKILRNLEEHLRERGIPYSVHGGVGFWQRQEILDMMQLCLSLAQPGDDLSLLGVLRGPAIGCNDADLLFLHFLGAKRLPRGLSILQTTDKDLVTACKPGALNRLASENLHSLQLAWKTFSQADRERLVHAARRVGLEGKWRLLADRMSHTDLLQLCLEESGAYRKYASQHDGEQVIANLGQFFEFLRLEESKPGASLARVAISLKQRAEDSIKDSQASVEVEGMDAVQIMTVHASKGLQFPLVVVPNLQRQIGSARSGRLAVDSQGRIGLKIRHPQRPREEEASQLHKKATEELQDRELAEARRLFYVATTRAEEVLILSAQKPRRNTSSWRQWFYDALNLEAKHFQEGVWEEGEVKVRLRSSLESNLPEVAPGERQAEVPVDLNKYSEPSRFSTIAVTSLEDETAEFDKYQANWHLRAGLHVQPNYSMANLNEIGSAQQAELRKKIGAVIGTVVHRAMERFTEWMELPTTSRQTWIERLVDAELGLAGREMEQDDEAVILDDEEIQVIKKRVNKLMEFAQSDLVLPLLKAKGKVEQDFVLPLSGWLIHGRMDKWMECPQGWMEIIDWKTDAGSAGASIERHRFQMQLYALALLSSNLVPESQTAVKVHLVLLEHEKVHVYQFERKALQEFRKGLEEKLGQMKTTICREMSEGELAALSQSMQTVPLP